jgi:hypothetical protein
MRCLLKSQSQRRSCAGQVIVEAAIGLALMTFAWILMTYSLYMGTNSIRTNMAARHAAWLKGATGNDATPSQIDQMFFYQSGLSKIENGAPVTVGDLFSDSGAKDSKDIGKGGHGPFLVTVSFGVADVNTATQFPFTLLKVRVPFMPALPTDISMVKSTCQWEEVGDTWTSWADALRGILDSLKSILPFSF